MKYAKKSLNLMVLLLRNGSTFLSRFVKHFWIIIVVKSLNPILSIQYIVTATKNNCEQEAFDLLKLAGRANVFFHNIHYTTVFKLLSLGKDNILFFFVLKLIHNIINMYY